MVLTICLFAHVWLHREKARVHFYSLSWEAAILACLVKYCYESSMSLACLERLECEHRNALTNSRDSLALTFSWLETCRLLGINQIAGTNSQCRPLSSTYNVWVSFKYIRIFANLCTPSWEQKHCFNGFDSDEDADDPIEDEHHVIFACSGCVYARQLFPDLFSEPAFNCWPVLEPAQSQPCSQVSHMG